MFGILFTLFIISFGSYANKCDELLTKKDTMHKIKESVIGFELEVSPQFLNLYESGKIPLKFPKKLHDYIIFGNLNWSYILDNDYIDYDELRYILLEKKINNEELYINFVNNHERYNGKRLPKYPHVLYQKYWIGRDFFFGEIILNKSFSSSKEVFNDCKSISRFFNGYSLEDKLRFLIKLRMLVKKDGTSLNEDYLNEVSKKEEYFLKTIDKSLTSPVVKKGLPSKKKGLNIKYVSYNEAQKYAIELNLKNMKEWIAHTESGDLAENVPKWPNYRYKNTGWETWGVFLGTGSVWTHGHTYIHFDKARDYVSKLGLKTKKEWDKYTRSKNKPANIPYNPYSVYKDDWQGWPYFLGKTNKKLSDHY